MPIAFDRGVCCDLQETAAREWLVTNGKGGYASGTVAGMLTRVQQGLLVASPQQGGSPQLLVAKIDEEVVFDQRTYYLGTNEYRDRTLNPAGFVHLETFRLEEGFPVFTYHLGGVDGMMLEKRIWMPQGLDTTFIQYRLLRTTIRDNGAPEVSQSGRTAFTRAHDAQRALSLTLLPFTGYRASAEVQRGALDWQFRVESQYFEFDERIAGCTITAHEGARPYSLFGVGHADSESTFLPTGVWYWHLLHREDQAAGQEATSDLYLPGVFRTKLWPGEDVSFTIILTAEDVSRLTFSTKSLKRAYEEAVDEQRALLHSRRYFGEGGATASVHAVLPLPDRGDDVPRGEDFLSTLMQAAHRLVTRRPLGGQEAASGYAPFLAGRTHTSYMVSSYYGGQEETRDSLIALPGLLLATGRYTEARRLLDRLGHSFHRGLLPDRLPWMAEGEDRGERDGRDLSRAYSVDTTLWYFYALDHYIQATGDYELLESLADMLLDCIKRYRRGTLNGIGVDVRDGLLQALWPGTPLTWMNATMPGTGGVAVTPRMGKTVEVNALWYHALSLMREWSGRFSFGFGAADEYEELRQQCRMSFNERFWYASGGYLYDVIDGPDGDDSSLRPNQLFALSLRHAVGDQAYWRSVLKAVTSQLLTPCGLRSLSPQDERYRGRISQDEEEQSSIHQGGAWPWLVGPYIDALLHVDVYEKQGRGYERKPERGRTGQARGNKTGAPGLNGSEKQTEQEGVWHRGIGLLDSFREQLRRDMLGAVGRVYDGDAPQHPHIYLASVISTGEIVRVYQLLAHMGVRFSNGGQSDREGLAYHYYH